MMAKTASKLALAASLIRSEPIEPDEYHSLVAVHPHLEAALNLFDRSTGHE